MGFEPMDEFERDLREAMLRRPAPPSLKRAVMERRWRERSQQRRKRMLWFERVAATLVLAAVAGGAAFWRSAEEHRRGEEAKQQVFTALRIANRALEHMNEQLQESDTH